MKKQLLFWMSTELSVQSGMSICVGKALCSVWWRLGWDKRASWPCARSAWPAAMFQLGTGRRLRLWVQTWSYWSLWNFIYQSRTIEYKYIIWLSVWFITFYVPNNSSVSERVVFVICKWWDSEEKLVTWWHQLFQSLFNVEDQHPYQK